MSIFVPSKNIFEFIAVISSLYASFNRVSPSNYMVKFPIMCKD